MTRKERENIFNINNPYYLEDVKKVWSEREQIKESRELPDDVDFQERYDSEDV